MKVITVNLPDLILNCLDKITRLGITPSRSEAIRQLIILGWEQWIKRLESVQEIIKIREENYDTSNGEVKIPKNGEYFDTDPLNIKTHKIIRRLE